MTFSASPFDDARTTIVRPRPNFAPVKVERVVPITDDVFADDCDTHATWVDSCSACRAILAARSRKFRIANSQLVTNTRKNSRYGQ